MRTDTDYQRIENREAIRLKLRQIARRVGDAAVYVADKQFDDAILQGEVLRIGYTDEELVDLVRTTAIKVLPSADKHNR